MHLHAHLHCFTNPIKKSEFTIICRKSWNIGKLCFLASSKMPFPIKTSYLQLYIVSTASCSKQLNSPHWWAVDMSLLLTYIGAHTRHIWDDTHLMCPSEIVSITAMFYPINTMAICSVHIVGMVAIYTALKLTETMFLSICVNLQIGVNLNLFASPRSKRIVYVWLSVLAGSGQQIHGKSGSTYETICMRLLL